nr:hypothetical protein [Tanacetum cinerariifolium]
SPKCGNPVDGHYYQVCALLRNFFKEDLFIYCTENGILQDTSVPSNDNTNIVNALAEPFVVKQDPDENSSQSAHYGYNCPPKVSIIPDPEPFNNQTVDELPQTLPSLDPTCYSKDGNSFTYDSKSNLVHDSPNVFDPPPQPPLYSYEFCGNDARYGHYCTPQILFVYPEPCYNQGFNFPHDFQQYLCCENCEGPHEAYQISSGSTTTRFGISLLDYEVFYDDHVKEISSGSTTTHFDSFIFDLSINPFLPADRSDFMSSPMSSLTSYLHQSMIVSALRMNPTRGISLWMWWMIFFQKENQ